MKDLGLVILVIAFVITFLTIATGRVDCLENHKQGQACVLGISNDR